MQNHINYLARRIARIPDQRETSRLEETISAALCPGSVISSSAFIVLGFTQTSYRYSGKQVLPYTYQSHTMASEREVLLLGILNQLDLTRKIDYKRLAHDVNAPTRGAAQKRWERFRKSLRESTSTSPTKSKGVQKTKRSPAKKNRSAKKDSSEDDERADDEMDGLAQESEIPARKLPSRKARVLVFKDESGQSDEVEDFEDGNEGGEEALELMDDAEEGLGSDLGAEI